MKGGSLWCFIGNCPKHNLFSLKRWQPSISPSRSPQRRMEAAAHQKISSIAAASPFDRGRIRNSGSRTARTARIVSTFVAGLPVSIREMVSCRRPVFSLSCLWLRPCGRPSCRSVSDCVQGRSSFSLSLRYVPNPIKS